jgi:hypothetical protein
MSHDVYLWQDPGAVLEALAIERAAYRAADLERRQLWDVQEDLMRKLTIETERADAFELEVYRLKPHPNRRVR